MELNSCFNSATCTSMTAQLGESHLWLKFFQLPQNHLSDYASSLFTAWTTSVLTSRSHNNRLRPQAKLSRSRPQVWVCVTCIRTVRTGTLLFLTTYSATLPKSRCASPERPWVPITIIWQFSSSATSTITGRGEASRTTVSACNISAFSSPTYLQLARGGCEADRYYP